MRTQRIGKSKLTGHYALCTCDDCLHTRNQFLNNRKLTDPNITDDIYRLPTPCSCSKCKSERKVVL